MPKISEPTNNQAQKTDDTPKDLKPYLFHGLELEVRGDNAVGACPFCLKEGKFAVKLANGVAKCWSCGIGSDKGGMNALTFLRLLWDKSDAATNDYTEVVKSRGFLDAETPMRWGCAKSIVSAEWLLPGRATDGRLTTLYAWRNSGGKRTLWVTQTFNHGLFLPPDFKGDKERLWLQEGPWNAMALWEVFKQAKRDEGALQQTGAEGSSLLADMDIVGLPGANVFKDEWVELARDKDVILCMDSDHPNKQGGVGAGPAGAKRIAERIAAVAKSLRWVRWGPDGYDPAKPSGFDPRDLLKGVPTLAGRIALLPQILDRIEPVPQEWVEGKTEAKDSAQTSGGGGNDIEPLPCRDWATLVTSWRKAMLWTDGLDCALSVMLASILSTRSAGDQLWVKIMGPPSCGKSTLCEAVSVNKKHVKAVSTIRGFHSGYRDPEGDGNSSLILKLKDKALVTKDGDTILQMGDRDRILSEARDLYDTTARSDYRNGMGMDHEGIRMTWILCGTRELRQLDQSQLGARFVDCVIMDQIDDDVEDAILDRVVNRAARVAAIRTNCTTESQHDPRMLEAMRLTGGYIDHLCNNGESLIGGTSEAFLSSQEAKSQVKVLGRFVAYMRARPAIDKRDEDHEKELPARLVSQLARLTVCLTSVLSRSGPDAEVMRRVKRTAIDTARGKTLDLCALFHTNPNGLDSAQLSVLTVQEEPIVKAYLRFLGKIGVLDHWKPANPPRGMPRPLMRWRMSPKMAKIYTEVMK